MRKILILLVVINFSVNAQNIKAIRFGSNSDPLSGLSITWQSSGLKDSLKWGYSIVLAEGKFEAQGQSNYDDTTFIYRFPALIADTTIHYSIYNSAIDTWTDIKTYKTSGSGIDNKIHFTALGDSRSYPIVWQTVSNSVPESDFTLFMGDIVAYGGTTSQWDDWFSYGQNFNESHLVYHSIGNHDLNSGTADIYQSLFDLPYNTNNNKRYYHFTHGNALFICLDSEIPADVDQYKLVVKCFGRK